MKSHNKQNEKYIFNNSFYYRSLKGYALEMVNYAIVNLLFLSAKGVAFHSKMALKAICFHQIH